MSERFLERQAEETLANTPAVPIVSPRSEKYGHLKS